MPYSKSNALLLVTYESELVNYSSDSECLKAQEKSRIQDIQTKMSPAEV